MLRKAHLNLIATHSLRHGLRGGAGLVSIALTLLIGLFLADCAVRPFEDVGKNIDRAAERVGADRGQRDLAKQQANEQIVELAVTVMGRVMDASDEQLDYLNREKPAMVSVLLVLLFIATPLLACLGAFNQTAGDIGSKGLRFLLFRTERSNIYWGRFFGTLGFTVLVNLLLFGIVAIYVAAKIDAYPKGEMLGWLFQGYLRMMLFTLPYVCLCSWISSANDSAFASLALSLLIAFFLPLFLAIAGSFDDNIKHAQFVTPWGFKYWLLQPIGGKFIGGMGAMLGFSALFLWLGHRNFNKRDL